MVRRSKSAGFTLVELLVVISIIGMLMSLVAVGVQGARESGRRTTCTNNQHQLVVALENFESTKRYFPGTSARVYRRTATLTSTQRAQVPIVSYIVQLFPYMERNDLWTGPDSTVLPWAKPWSDRDKVPSPAPPATTRDPHTPYIALLTCPSDPPETTDRPYLAYVINGGIEPGAAELNPTPPPLKPWPAVLRMASGIAFDQTGTVANESIRVGKDYVDSNDGTSTTLLLSETIRNSFWMPSNGAMLSPGTARTWTTFLWTNKGKSAAVPSSKHSGGYNAHFADSHYQFIDNNIDYRVYNQLMTPANELLPDSFRMPLLNTANF